MGESIAAVADLGANLFEAAAPAAEAGLETGIGTVGSGIGGAASSLGDIVGSGAGLFGGTTGLEGTAIAGGGLGDIGSLIGGGAGTALGTAESFMGAPGASGFNAGAMTANPAAFGGVTSFGPQGGAFPTSGSLPAGVSNANAGASVFDTGAAPVQNISSTGAPAAGTNASSVAAPAGTNAVSDPTAASATGAGTAGTGAAGTSGTAATGGGTSITDLLKNAGSGAVKSLTSNPLGIALGAAGLGYNMLQGQKQTPNQSALTADAKQATANSNQMVASGEALQQYLTNGTLPPAYQQQVNDAISAAKTTAISNAAAMGMPTDPTKNTSLAAELAKIDASRAGMQAQVAQTLFSSGTSLVNAGQTAANLSGNLYQSLVQNDTASAANTGKAIATLAAALNGKSGSGGSSGLNINVGGAPSASVVNPGAGQNQFTG